MLEIRPRSVYQLPLGSRVCTVWSSAYICLFPGTIVSPDEPLPPDHVLVELDDGDSRLVEVDKIRMLPSDYSRVGESSTTNYTPRTNDVISQSMTRIPSQRCAREEFLLTATTAWPVTAT